MSEFYVYVYFDPRSTDKYTINGKEVNSKPVYVGKGRGNRVLKHLKSTKKTKLINLNKHLIKEGIVPSYQIIKEFDSENAAHAFEKKLISEIGREDLGEGPLFNLTDGGEGCSGKVYTENELLERGMRAKAYFDGLTREELKLHGQKSLKNRNPKNVEYGNIRRIKSRNEWSHEMTEDVERRRRASWERSYCNTQEKKDRRKNKCSRASLKRKMFYLTYENEDGSFEGAFLKDLISRGWGKDAIEWRIKGKLVLEKPYRVRVENRTIIIRKVEKKPYSNSLS